MFPLSRTFTFVSWNKHFIIAVLLAITVSASVADDKLPLTQRGVPYTALEGLVGPLRR